jgi:hypothetical protein
MVMVVVTWCLIQLFLNWFEGGAGFMVALPLRSEDIKSHNHLSKTTTIHLQSSLVIPTDSDSNPLPDGEMPIVRRQTCENPPPFHLAALRTIAQNNPPPLSAIDSGYRDS